MNVAISTFVRRGYLLTALAVAVLLAGFSGTAWAQTTGVSTTATSRFSGSSGTLPEGAATAPLSKPRPLKVTITRTTKSANDPYNTSDDADVGPGSGAHLNIHFEYNGTEVLPTGITVKADASNVATGASVELADGASLIFAPSDPVKTREEKTGKKVDDTSDPPKKIDELHTVTIHKDKIVLTIEDDRTTDDGDWLPEKFVMTVSKHANLGAATKSAGTRTNPFVNDFTSSKFTVTIADDDPKPKFRFSSRNIQLATENIQIVTASVGVGPGGASPVPGEDDNAEDNSIGGKLKSLPGTLPVTGEGDGIHDVWLTVGPPDAVGRLINIRDDSTGTGDNTIIHPDAMGRYVIGVISEAVPTTGDDGIEFRIEAKEVSGFRDEQVTLMLMDGRTAEQAEADGGGIDDADPATVTVLSGEETPTVTFSTESIDIDEGDSETVHILAGGMQGDEVGAVTVAVRGEALISLEQNGSPIGGTVSFGGNANAELTIVSNSDPSLEDGEEKTATVTITDASGALIGDPGTVTVTVVGSTAVPVLPLFGQLLLALLLMVGGARLYRRRQG